MNMSTELYLAFILASVALALTPGPTMSLIIANGATYGMRAGLVTVAGGGFGLGMLVTAAILGMGSIVALMANWFDLIRWVGAAYLVWLGASRLYRAVKSEKYPADPPRNLPRGRWFWQGLAVALSNPKVLLFLGAFFPQFVDPQAALGQQFALLAVTFLSTMLVIDSGYAVLAGTARRWFTGSHMRIADGLSGVLLMGGGIWLALARRT